MITFLIGVATPLVLASLWRRNKKRKERLAAFDKAWKEGQS